jgi:hypothetical protein
MAASESPTATLDDGYGLAIYSGGRTSVLHGAVDLVGGGILSSFRRREY